MLYHFHLISWLTWIVHTAFSIPGHACVDVANNLLGFDFNKWIMQPHWQLGPTSSIISVLLIEPNVFVPKKYSQMLSTLPLHGRVSVVGPCYNFSNEKGGGGKEKDEKTKLSHRATVRIKSFHNSICESRLNEFFSFAHRLWSHRWTYLAIFPIIFRCWWVAYSVSTLNAPSVLCWTFAPIAPPTPFSINWTCVTIW